MKRSSTFKVANHNISRVWSFKGIAGACTWSRLCVNRSIMSLGSPKSYGGSCSESWIQRSWRTIMPEKTHGALGSSETVHKVQGTSQDWQGPWHLCLRCHKTRDRMNLHHGRVHKHTWDWYHARSSCNHFRIELDIETEGYFVSCLWKFCDVI